MIMRKSEVRRNVIYHWEERLTGGVRNNENHLLLSLIKIEASEVCR